MSRIVIVTGAASGIGAALCRRLAGAGDTVVLADFDGAGAQRVAAEIDAQHPGRAHAVCVDVRDADAVQSLVDDAVARHGRIDLLMNNAGVGIGGAAQDLTLPHWDRAIDVNLRGVIHGVHAVLPQMLRQGSGQIVNTASLAGLIPSPFLAPYVATKHAVVGLTLALRLELAGQGVRCNVVCPGFTDTPILDRTEQPGLAPVASAPPVRALAQALPGGIYDLEDLVTDIVTGIAADDPLIVAPAAARATWQAWRTSPEAILAAGERQAQVIAAGVARGT